MPEKGGLIALGRHSQRILVLPKYDIVAAMTEYMPDDEFYPVDRFIDDIVAAGRSNNALPPDPIGQSALAASIGAAANEQSLPVGGTLALQQTVSGRTYRLDENELHIATISLQLMGGDPMWILATNGGRPVAVTNYFHVPLGLDGRFRLAAPDQFGIAAARGRWVSDNSFEVERRILGHSETQHWFLTFEGNNVTIHFVDTDGDKADVHGRAT
jgi:hypothetical protein